MYVIYVMYTSIYIYICIHIPIYIYIYMVIHPFLGILLLVGPPMCSALSLSVWPHSISISISSSSSKSSSRNIAYHDDYYSLIFVWRCPVDP